MIAALAELTRRQRQVLRTYAACWSRKETAFRLGIGEHTVRRHLQAIHARYGLSTMGEIYLALGWLVVPPPDIGPRGQDGGRAVPRPARAPRPRPLGLPCGRRRPARRDHEPRRAAVMDRWAAMRFEMGGVPVIRRDDLRVEDDPEHDLDGPDPFAADSLDAAWAEAEAALPEGWAAAVRPIRGGGLHEPPYEAYRAFAFLVLIERGVVQSDIELTPAAALRALAAKLRERAG